MIQHTTIRGLCLAVAFSMAAMVAPGAGAEESLVVDASSISPSSPRQWVYDGAEATDGATGPEISMLAGPDSTLPDPDLYLSFDDVVPSDASGRWSTEAIGPYERSAVSRFGAGAGTFRAPATKLVLQPASDAVFTPDLPLGDLSLEFWLKPTRADSGEIVFLWKATRKIGKERVSQQISCIVLRNRMVFGFLNFFSSPEGKQATMSLQGTSVLVPGAWSHHLVRFDSSTGLLEYVMNGRIEAVTHATATGKQAGTVYNPVPGGSGRLELAPNYTGLMDEFRLTQAFVEAPALRRFPAAGAIVVSPVFDLGATNSSLLAIQAQTRTPGESAVQWSYRFGDSSAGWRDDDPAWVPFSPGAALAGLDGAPRGRYLQLRMALYPDAPGERAPAVSSIRISYEPDRAPNPPTSVQATPGDGRISIHWPTVSEADIAGYVVYYGLTSGDYFGSGAVEGSSPVFVKGSRITNLTLNGLRNGTLYFIAVAAFDDANPPHIGELSRETSARPSRVSP